MKSCARASNVLVIGAGVGGIAAAARLARQGYAVTVVEKGDRPGGRCGRMTVDGYTFETGATIFLMPSLYARAFAGLGERMEDHLELLRVDPTYHLFFRDDSKMKLTSDLQRMQTQLEAVEPESFGRMLRYLAEGGRHFRFSLDHIVEKDFQSIPEFINPSTLLNFLRMDLLRSHYGYAKSFFHDPRLLIAFTFQNMYMGLSPYDAPATYSLLQYTELADGLWYPRGGMYAIVEALVNIAQKHGVKFQYNAPVRKIITNGNRATGVEFADGKVSNADILLANADLGYVYRNLLPQDATAGRINRMEYGCSTVMFYWGMDTKIPGLGLHNVFFSGDYHRNFDAVLKEESLPAEPNFYLHTAAGMDPSAAPPGHDAWAVAVPVGHIRKEGSQDWPSIQSRARDFVLRRLARAGLGDVAKHIRIERSTLPGDWQSRYNLPGGSTHGLSHKLTQMGYFRPHNHHSRFRNLYFVGSSTHPGTGVPMVLVSSRFAAERILRENKI